jgi:hypothetical protein
MNTRNLPKGKGRPASKAGNLTVICEPTVWRLDISQPYGLPQPVTGIALLYRTVYFRVFFCDALRTADYLASNDNRMTDE